MISQLFENQYKNQILAQKTTVLMPKFSCPSMNGNDLETKQCTKNHPLLAQLPYFWPLF
jgi:hypothetical protein